MRFQPGASRFGFSQTLAREGAVDVILAKTGRFRMGMPQ
jgi:hypothetical protein